MSACKHLFTKGSHRGNRCTIIPHKSEEYCSKHRSCKHAMNQTVVKKNSRGTARSGIIIDSATPVIVFADTHTIPDPPDTPNSLGDNDKSCNVSTTKMVYVYDDDDYDWWEEHVYVPPMDPWGSDCCTWSPSVVLY